jgi:hypothetical protein
MATLNMNATPETVWALLQETDRLIKETRESQKETDRIVKENAAQQKKTDEQMKKTDLKLDKLEAFVNRVTKNVGGLNNDIGDFAEGLLTSDLLKKFQKYDLDFDDALWNIEINERGTKRPIAEIDWLLLNTTIALVGEVKANLTVGDVDKHITRMKKLSSTQNNLLGGKELYGAVAGIKMTQTTRDYAKKRGFFVLEPAGDSVKIEAPVGDPTVW